MTARVAAVLGLIALVAFALLLGHGWEYYRLPSVRRPLHPLHADLRSSGSVGLACGVAAAALFLLNLVYLLRKRFAATAWLGNLRAWMAMHIFTGFAAAACAVAHSALLPSSMLGRLALAGLGIVLVAGLVGRYIYGRVPRTIRGRELESEELRKRLREHRARLHVLGVDADLLELPEPDMPKRKSLLGRLAGLVAGDRRVRRDFRRIRLALRARTDRAHILPIVRRLCRDQHFLARYGELRGLMGSWRFLHRWLAIMMLLVVAFHVGLALRFGDIL